MNRPRPARQILPLRRVGPAASVMICALALAGCGLGGSNLSPTPDADPDRYAQALKQVHAFERERQQAEAHFFQQVRRKTPVPAIEQEPMSDIPSIETTSR